MAVVTRAAAKAYFETGDKPTQSQFIDTLDSTLFQEDVSTLGKALVSAATTASAQNLLGIPGINIPGAVGNIILTATTTASAQNQMGGGTVGEQIFSAITTASVANIIGGAVPVTAAQSDQEAGTTGAKFTSPSTQQFHPSASKAWLNYTTITTTTILASYGVTSLTDNGTGSTTVNFTTNFSTGNYCSVGMGSNSTGAPVAPILQDGSTSPTTSAARYQSVNFAGIATDSASQQIAIFGDQ